MRRFADSRRFVYNKGLAGAADGAARYGRDVPELGRDGRLLTAARNSADTRKPWLRDAPIHPLQEGLKDPDDPYSDFFEKRAAFPRLMNEATAIAFAISTRSRSSSIRLTADLHAQARANPRNESSPFTRD